MPDPRADVALLIDFTDLCSSLMPESGESSVSSSEAAADGPVLAPERAATIAAALTRFSSEIGRVAIARAYADWSRCAVLAREVSKSHLEPILVPATVDGEDRSHIRLVTDALEALYAGDEPDAFVLVTGDPTLLPLVQKIRADGSEVVIIAPEGTIGEEFSAEADRYITLEQVLGGEAAAPARPRPWRGNRSAGGGAPRPRAPVAPAPEAVRERPSHPTPVQSEADFADYDWTPFVKLIDELEHRLPFVGVRYLVNKVLAMHNCGIDDPRLKRDLINRAVEEGVIEMYPVGNVGDRADPVTACRLDRASEGVIDVIGATEAPDAPEEHPPEELMPEELMPEEHPPEELMPEDVMPEECQGGEPFSDAEGDDASALEATSGVQDLPTPSAQTGT